MIKKLLLFVRSLFLNFSNSSKERSFIPGLRMLCLGMFFVVSFANAATRTASSSGAWSSTSTWVGGILPVAGDDVVINSGVIVTLDLTTPTLLSVTVNAATANNGITFNSNSVLNISGALTVNSVSATTGSITSTVAVGAGILNAGSISISGNTNTNRSSTVSVSSGTINVTNITFSGTIAQARLTFTGSGTLNIAGDLGAGGTFTAGTTSTVNFNNAGAQNIRNYAYNNLTISGSGIKTLIANTTVNGALNVKANTTLAMSTFTLTTPTSVALECGAVAGSIISGSGTLTLGGTVTVTDITTGTSGATISCPVALGGNRIFNVGDDGSTATDLTISGVISGGSTLTKNGVGTLILSGSNTYTGTTTVSAGTLKLGNTAGLGTTAGATTIISGAVLDLNGINLGAESLTLNGTGLSSSPAGALTNTGGNASYSGAITLGSAITITATSSGTLTCSGTIGTGVFGLTLDGVTGSSGIMSGIISTPSFLNKEGLGTWTLSGSNTYTGTTSVNAGTLSLGVGEVFYGTLAIAGGASVVTNGNAVTFRGGFTNSGTFTAGSSAITISGTATQSIDSFTTTGTVTMSKTGNSTATFNGNVTGGALTINGNGGTLNLGTSLTHTFSGNWTRTIGTLNGGSSILKIGGDVSGTVGTFTANTGTVEFNNAGAQSLGTVALTFNNLILSNSGTKTFSASITISGNLNINSGVVANLSTVTTHTAGTLTLGGATTPGGSWGSTTSTANNKNNTFFDTTIGLINVGSSCTAPLTFSMTGANDQAYCSTESGTTIGLSGSESGVNYQLYRGTVAVGSPVAGTGLAISFGAFNTTGKYTVTASKVSTLCTATMSGGPITVYKYSSPPTITGTASNVACPTDATGTISITNASNPASLAFVRAGTDATTQGVDLSQRLLSNRAKFTVEGWIKFDNLNYVTRMSIFGQNNAIEVAFEQDNLRCYTAGGGQVDMPKSEITPGLWYHIAVTGDGTVGGLKIYLNGVLKSSAGSLTSNYGSDTNYSTKIGYAVMDAAGNGLTGEIFKVGFWSEALLPADVAKLAAGFVDYDASFSTLIAGYSFNDGPSATSLTGVGSSAPVGTFVNLTTAAWTDPYVYSWSSAPAGYTSTGKNLTGLLPRTYNVTTSLRNCTSSASFTVNATNTAPSITTQPSPTSTCVANNASFTIVGSGTGVNYQWEVSTGGVFTGLTNTGVYSNVTTATMNITGATSGMNNYQYRCIVGGTCTPSVTSNPVVLTVNTPSVAPTSISGITTICNGSSTTLTAVGGTLGTGATYQWGTGSVVGTSPISGATSISYATGALSSNATYWVRIENTASPCTATTGGISQVVTVNTPSVAPTSISGTTTICNGSSTTLTAVGGTLGTGATYQWGTGSVVGTSPISGATSISYATGALSSNATYWVRIENTASPCAATTGGISQLVTVNQESADPTSASASLTTICNGGSTTLTLNGGGGGTGETIKWYTASCGGTLAGTGNNLSVSPITTTTYYGRYENGAPCNYNSVCSSVTITVNALPTAIAGGSQAICSNATATVSGATSSNGTILWTENGAGSITSGATTLTPVYTAAPGDAGNTVTLTMTVSNSPCTNATATYSVIVNALPTTPTATVTIQPTCSVNTGTIVVTAPTGAGITYSIDGTNYFASGTFSNVAVGSHTVSVKNSSDCVATMASPLSVSPPVTKTWLGGQGSGSQLTDWSYGPNWNPAGIPTSADCVIIPTTPNNPIISGTNLEFYANTLSVIANGSLVVQSGNTLKVTDAITVAPTGTLTFQDSSTLLQESTDNTINTGSIEYVRTTLPIRQADYVYWSTPVKGQTLAAVSPLTESNKYFRFDGTGWVATPKTNVMIVGKGYIIRGPEGTSNTVRAPYTATFRGTPNNGTVTSETYDSGKNYLIGNPYPSAIDADKFLSDLNNKGVLQGTLYFWTHNTPVTLGGYYRYNADDYASYNLSGGTKTMKAAKTANDAPGNINSAPQGYIAAGQSFMAGFSFPGQIQFTNSMRIGADKNAQFFKPGKTSKTTGIEKNRVWLNLTNEEGAFKQMLVGYIEGASNDYDRGYDGLSFDGNKYIDFYSIGGTRKFVIQGRALPFTDTDTVPLGYKTTIAGDFTISIDQADGIFTTQSIYLEDKITGKIQDLRAANYTFTTAIGNFADRFVLRYTNKTLGTGDFENVENGLLVSVKDKTIKVISAKENIKEVTVFDINGKLLYNKKKVGSTELQIANLQSVNQVLLVKVTLENDYAVTKKIVFQ
ncbi:autotransporter-associated beta strand repeat-containing protein [Flavobacterium sp. MDT1-60]|uniref:autotransporter-associated beta strand repeat-containing protein n=1 Tax=Flavobacterium sp. MDT1-60 TaxID=1979344 RepID=UPI0017808F36|nr:autotransporter-associated beta strand repeat-containing protein [Flavobacterium sp. MDT1-60]QOG03322.1 T9SS sorting signal type C domain-containing protein [Flavobacterium sp. MDT1-60]